MRTRIQKQSLYFMVPARVFSIDIRSARMVGGIFSVHPTMEGHGFDPMLWTVTHHKTGFAISQYFPSRAKAVAAARAFSRIRAPWNFPDRWKIVETTPKLERMRLKRITQKFQKREAIRR